jgi:hypothetical protein
LFHVISVPMIRFVRFFAARLRPGLAGGLAVVLTLVSAFCVSPVSALVSDDFHSSTLNTAVWRFDDPVGDVTLVMTGTNVVMSVPGGINHDLTATGPIRSPRLMQTAANTDFDVEAKFDSRGSRAYESQGIMVQVDADTYFRFEVLFGNATPRLYAAYHDAGVRTTKVNLSLATPPPYIRVTRSGNSWTFRYSYNGVAWTSAAPFTQAAPVTEVGVYFSNTPLDKDAYWDTPAFVGNVDYFFDRAAPINPEDGGAPTVPTPPVVEIWYGDHQDFGHLGIPQQWVNIVGRVWDTEAPDTLFYRLNGGAGTPLDMGPDGTRLVGAGDYNIEIDYDDLIPGENQVVITAIDTLGERRDTTVVVDYTAGKTWAVADTARFEATTAISEEAHVVDGKWYLVPGVGVRVDSAATGYDRLLVLGDHRWKTDYEVLLPMTIHATQAGELTGIGLGLGWQGHTGSGQPRVEAPFQAITWIRDFPANPTLILEQPGLEMAVSHPSVEANVRYMMRTRSQSLGDGMSRVSTRFWRDGTPEPVAWDLTADVPAFDGSVILIAHRAIATFGDVHVWPLTPLTGIESPSVVNRLTLRQQYPNPFRTESRLDYGLPRASDVDITIYDVAGRRVYQERVRDASPGWNEFVFRGRDQKGRALPSGVYFFRMTAGGEAATRKIVLLR